MKKWNSKQYIKHHKIGDKYETIVKIKNIKKKSKIYCIDVHTRVQYT